MTGLDGFASHDVDVDGVRVHAAVGGSGPPVLLLHGYPQTHLMWHRVAPGLARDHTVVAADLRGYGASGRPAGGNDHAGYAKRAMAADQVGLMAHLGFERFDVVGHDRGARVTHRLCRDHPDRVTRAAVIDIVPTLYVYDHVDRALAQAYHHWFFLSQPDDLPEHLLGGDPEFHVRRCLRAWSQVPGAFDADVVSEYVRAFADPATIHATCEDYRAGASIDLTHDRDDPSLVGCPLLVLWGAEGFVGTHYDVLGIWRDAVSDPGLVSGQALPGGHFVPEEAPEQTVAALRAFLTPDSGAAV